MTIKILGFVAAGLLVVVAVPLAFSQEAAQVTIDDGISPTLTIASVTQLAEADIRNMGQLTGGGAVPRVISAHAMRSDAITKDEPNGPIFDPARAGATVWLVRATGTFVGQRGKGPDQVFKSGYLIIDDATGEVIAMGMP